MWIYKTVMGSISHLLVRPLGDCRVWSTSLYDPSHFHLCSFHFSISDVRYSFNKLIKGRNKQKSKNHVMNINLRLSRAAG